MVYGSYDALEIQPKQFVYMLIFLVLVPQRLDVKKHGKIMELNHNPASIIAQYHIPNMAAVFSYCMLGEPDSLLPHTDI